MSSINSTEHTTILQPTTPAPALIAALGETTTVSTVPVNASGLPQPVGPGVPTVPVVAAPVAPVAPAPTTAPSDVVVEVVASAPVTSAPDTSASAVVEAVGVIAGAVNNAVGGGGAAGAIIADVATVAAGVAEAAEADTPTIQKVKQLLASADLAPASRRLLERLQGRLPEAITPDNIMVVTRMAIEAVELLSDLRGQEKKDAVMDVIGRLNGVLVADEQRSVLMLVITEVIPNTIDLIVSASKGSMNINKVQTCCVSFMKLFK